jgi:glycosyltransferase involved in cell wall biosynthesis
MKEVVKCSSDKYIVSEGIYEEQVTKRIPHQEDPSTFTLFYGGMLYEKFGIMNLVNAFHSIADANMKLQLCGYGDCVDRVKELSKKDTRIQYLGVVNRDKVLELQSRASLLVNPRIPDGNPFTRYSFPSKTMEYFASGTPTLLYQLDGIPHEYYQYCYSLDAKHTSIADLANKILEIKRMPVEERVGLAQKARTFVLEKKNPRIEAERICELLSRT